MVSICWFWLYFWRVFIFITYWFFTPVFFRCKEMPSVLWRCWLGVRKGIRPVKNWVVGCWHGCLGWGADLHITQQMPLPLTISCFSKSRLALTFLVLPFWYLLDWLIEQFLNGTSTQIGYSVPSLVPAHPGGPGHTPEEQYNGCVCVFSFAATD